MQGAVRRSQSMGNRSLHSELTDRLKQLQGLGPKGSNVVPAHHGSLKRSDTKLEALKRDEMHVSREESFSNQTAAMADSGHVPGLYHCSDPKTLYPSYLVLS